MEEVTALNQSFTVIKDSHRVSGMTCASCAVNVESYLDHVEGVR